MTQQFREFVGFTLIEVLLAIGIVGLLAAIAYPSYQDALRKAQRADATNTLLKIQIAQEKYRNRHPVFTSDLADLPVHINGIMYISAEGNYQITMNYANEVAYEVEAVPVPGGKQEGDECHSFLLNQSGPVIDTDSSKMCWNQ